jgi:RNA polymerase sigma-70 factor (sigma-E family)
MANDPIAFDVFVADHIDGLLRTAYLITADEQEAEDLVQECLLSISRRWSRVSLMEHPLAYARRALINQAVRGSKSRWRRHTELSADVPDIVPSPDEFETVEMRDALRNALKQLAPKQRAVLVLRYFNDLSERQVADMLGCSVGNVKSTASRALTELNHAIEPGLFHERSDHT